MELLEEADDEVDEEEEDTDEDAEFDDDELDESDAEDSFESESDLAPEAEAFLFSLCGSVSKKLGHTSSMAGLTGPTLLFWCFWLWRV